MAGSNGSATENLTEETDKNADIDNAGEDELSNCQKSRKCTQFFIKVKVCWQNTEECRNKNVSSDYGLKRNR